MGMQYIGHQSCSLFHFPPRFRSRAVSHNMRKCAFALHTVAELPWERVNFVFVLFCFNNALYWWILTAFMVKSGLHFPVQLVIHAIRPHGANCWLSEIIKVAIYKMRCLLQFDKLETRNCTNVQLNLHILKMPKQNRKNRHFDDFFSIYIDHLLNWHVLCKSQLQSLFTWYSCGFTDCLSFLVITDGFKYVLTPCKRLHCIHWTNLRWAASLGLLNLKLD